MKEIKGNIHRSREQPKGSEFTATYEPQGGLLLIRD